jgi:H+/Cl- antiporter ClcA
LSKSTLGIVCWFLFLLLLTFLIGKFLKWDPDISGSGIPQIEAELTGHLDQKWWRVIIAKIAGGALSILGGLSLGREGPSIQLGGMTGKGYAQLTNKTNYEERYLITCGASAGLSAAFNAPLAGVMFALEEVHKHFSVSVLLSAMSASIVADFISKYIFGLSPVFSFSVTENIPLKYYGLLILLGVLLGFFGALYNKTIPFLQDLFEKIKVIPPQYIVVIPLLMAGVFAFTYPQLLGSGHQMIELLHEGNLVFKSVLLLFTLKFIFSTASFSSSAPGGIFFPLLVLGGYIGCAYGMLSIKFFGLNEMLLNNFIILAMAGFFAAIVRAPLTGIILLCEMTGSFSQFLSVSVVAMFAYITVEYLKVEPIYDQLLKRRLKHKVKKEPLIRANKKLYSNRQYIAIPILTAGC